MHWTHAGAEESGSSALSFKSLYLFYIVLYDFSLALIETSYFPDQSLSLCSNEIL